MAGNMSSLVSHDKLATLETILKHGRDNKHDKVTIVMILPLPNIKYIHLFFILIFVTYMY